MLTRRELFLLLIACASLSWATATQMKCNRLDRTLDDAARLISTMDNIINKYKVQAPS